MHAVTDAPREIPPQEDLMIIPPVLPPFVHKIGRLAGEMSFGDAVIQTFDDARIGFELEGELPAEQGLVIASDHRQRIEPLLIQAAMGLSGRDGSGVLAMPTSFAGRIIQGSGQQGKDLVIPVIPSAFSTDNKPSLSPRSVYRSTRFQNVFGRPKSVLRDINARALTQAAGRVDDGQAVMVCPTGDDNDAAYSRWFRGFGDMVRQLPPEAQQEAHLAVFRSDSFSNVKVMGSLLLRDVGVRPAKRQTIVLRAVSIGSPYDVLGPLLTSEDPAAAQAISDSTHSNYRAVFNDHI